MEDEPHIPLEISLQLSVKAMNDTVNPEGMIPSLLVFGTVPRFDPPSSQLPDHDTQMRAQRQLLDMKWLILLLNSNYKRSSVRKFHRLQII